MQIFATRGSLPPSGVAPSQPMCRQIPVDQPLVNRAEIKALPDAARRTAIRMF